LDAFTIVQWSLVAPLTMVARLKSSATTGASALHAAGPG
jgi:hypothetical protein